MKQYHNLLRHVLANGIKKSDRTGTGTISVFGFQMRFDLQEGFPLLTTKKLHTKSIIHELLWFLKGDTNIKYLSDNGVGIWNEWADANGNLGPVYGYQWRKWLSSGGKHIDQIKNIIGQIKKNPDSRRLIVSAWNVADIDKMKLPPCHVLFQFYVTPPDLHKPACTKPDYAKRFVQAGVLGIGSGEAKGKLHCQLYQRSADIFIGVPFNIASYSLLTMMVAQVCDLEPGEFIHTFGDAHIYSNHLEQVNIQLLRECRPLPQMKINSAVKNIFDFKFADFTLDNYNPHPHIKADVAV